jgi:uncharacterized protein YoxC
MSFSSGINCIASTSMNQLKFIKETCRKISLILFTIFLNESLKKIRKTLDDNLEMISAYADDIVIIAKPRGNLNRVIKMVETELNKLNLKINKKTC